MTRCAVAEDKAMSAREFRDDDTGYLEWLTAHPAGYVINIRRSHSATDARVHNASCWTISVRNQSGDGSWTGQFVKVCAEHLVEAEEWAAQHVSASISIEVRKLRPGPSRRATHSRHIDRGRCLEHRALGPL